MVKKRVLRFFTVFLAFGMLLGIVQLSFFGNLDRDITGFAVFGPGQDNAESRGSNWDIISNGQGSFSILVYNSPINHYNGTDYVQINETVVVSSDPLYDYEVNGTGIYSAFFDVDPTTGQPVKYVRDDVEVAFRPMPLNYINQIGQLEQISNVLAVTGVPSENSFSYSGVYGLGIDLRYLYLPNILKEELVINSFSDLPIPTVSDPVNISLEMNFNFNTNAPRLIVEGTDILAGNNNIETKNSVEVQDVSGNILYHFPKPYAFDSNGSQQELTYFFKKQGPSLSIRLLTPYDWLNASERVYPVFIDPSISIGVEEGGGDAYVDSNNPGKNYGEISSLRVDDASPTQRIYHEFNISAIPLDQQIDDAELCMYLFFDSSGAENIYVHHVYNTSWCEGNGGIDGIPACEITHANQPCGTDFTNSVDCNLTAEDFLSNDGSQDGTWQCWNVRDMVSKSYTESSEFVAMALLTNSSGNADKFRSKEYTKDANLWPYLNVIYSTAATAPEVNVIVPQEGSTLGVNESIELDFTAINSTSPLDSCWYTLDGGDTNVTLAGCANSTFNVSGDGSYTVWVYANETVAGLIGSDNANFSVQLGAPSIALSSPVDEFLNHTTDIEFVYTATDVDLDSCQLWGDFTGVFELNQTNTSVVSGVQDSFFLNLSDNTYSWNVYCNDTQGNAAFDGNQTFYVDTIFPIVSLTKPSGTYDTLTGIELNFSASDANLESCFYNVSFSNTGDVVLANTIAPNCTGTTFNVNTDGNYILHLTANDSAGNFDFVNSSFGVDTSTSPPSDSSGGGGSGGGGGGIITGLLGPAEITLLVLPDMEFRRGETEIVSLNVINSGTRFLNECKMEAEQGYLGWISSRQIESLGSGQQVDYVFSINVPLDAEQKRHVIDVFILCNEANSSTPLTIEVIVGDFELYILSSERVNNKLKVVYSLEEFSGQDREVIVSYSFVTVDGVTLLEDSEEVFIRANERKEFTLEFDLPKDSIGEFNIILDAVYGRENSRSEQRVALSAQGVTGFAVSDANRKTLSIFVIVVLVVVSLYLILKFLYRHNKRIKLHETKKRHFIKIDLRE